LLHLAETKIGQRSQSDIDIDLMQNDQSLLINRDLSWLEFNRRVLEEAKDPSVPLLERVKFLAIFSCNLDEFFMVRVAGLKRRANSERTNPDAFNEAPVLTAISQKVHELAEEQHVCFLETILPQLTAEGVHLLRPQEISREQEQFLEDYFHKMLYPIVTPLAIDPGHPFPYLANRSLCLVVSLRAKDNAPLPRTELSIVHIPGHVVRRFIQLPSKEGQYAFVLLEDVLRQYLPRLYHGFDLLSTHAIRVDARRRIQGEYHLGQSAGRSGRGVWISRHKTHCKACLIVRQEADGIRRYCHLSTGNYNARTTGVYSDIGLFTCRDSFGEDLTELFNLLTGYARPQKFHHLVLAPSGLREHFVTLIRREAEQARAGRPARIIAKVNSLIDTAVIEELYNARQAGVQIDLIVRGMCSLRPGLEGVSEGIRVLSIVDRYLEHARIFYFQNGGNDTLLLASADWMPRNFDRRIEIAFPVLEPRLQAKLKDFLELQLADAVKGWWMKPDGTYIRSPDQGMPGLRFQERFYEIVQAKSRSSAAKGVVVE
jgi:polyphosphate kinase